MKTVKLVTVFSAFLFVLSSFSAKAIDLPFADKPSIEINQEAFEQLDDATQQQVLVLTARLSEIYDMDRSELTKSERKAIKKELSQIKKDIEEINETSHGGHVVYLSTGGLIILILLLIIIF